MIRAACWILAWCLAAGSLSLLAFEPVARVFGETAGYACWVVLTLLAMWFCVAGQRREEG